MRKTLKYLFFLFIALLIIQCNPAEKVITGQSSTPMNSGIDEKKDITAFIQPYKDSLDKEMNEVLVTAAEEFPKERDQPETKLGNLVADLSLEIANKLYQPDNGQPIDFCLLNNGGLRTSLPKGEITRGKVFELMPFENELVVITIDKEHLNRLIDYLYSVSPQPISKGITLVKYDILDGRNFKDGLYTKENKYRLNNKFKILTTDYLANGGDKMNFFLDPLKYEKVGIKLRDAIIQYCIEENKKGHQLTGKTDGRITFE